jgi:hypothetical protein
MNNEFKGTKGKWVRVKLPKTEFFNERNEIHYGTDGECVAEFVANDYDAQLISKAPELLNNAQMHIDALDLSNIEFYNKYGFNVAELMTMTRELVYEATTI